MSLTLFIICNIWLSMHCKGSSYFQTYYLFFVQIVKIGKKKLGLGHIFLFHLIFFVLF